MFACQVGVVLCLTAVAASRMTLGGLAVEAANTVPLFLVCVLFLPSSSRGVWKL